MWQTCIFWTCNCYKTRIEWKINGLIKRNKNHDILRYKFRIAIRYKFFVYCDIPIYRYIVTPLARMSRELLSYPNKYTLASILVQIKKNLAFAVSYKQTYNASYGFHISLNMYSLWQDLLINTVSFDLVAFDLLLKDLALAITCQQEGMPLWYLTCVFLVATPLCW